MSRHLLAAGFILAVLAAATVAAHEDGGREDRPRGERHGHRDESLPVPAGVRVPAWAELTPAQQEKLAPMREHWDSLPASRRVRALERLERRARWEALPPEEREKLRQGARNFRDLPPELREKMRASMEAMHALPEDERHRLRKLWHGLSPEQRREWLQSGGPGISPPPPPRP